MKKKLAGGVGVGPLIVWLLSLAGIHVDEYIAALLASIVSSFGVALLQNGVRNLALQLWRGKPAPPA